MGRYGKLIAIRGVNSCCLLRALVSSDSSNPSSYFVSRTSCKIVTLSFMDKEAEAPRESKTHPNSQRQNQDLNPGSLGLAQPHSHHSVSLTLEQMLLKNKKST